MLLRWRFSGGVLFSLILHGLLLLALFYWYPGTMRVLDGQWISWLPFYEKTAFDSRTSRPVAVKFPEAPSAGTLIFPEIVLPGPPPKLRSVDPSTPQQQSAELPKLKIRNPKFKTQNSKLKTQNSLKGVLGQVEQFPERLEATGTSKKELSAQVGSLLSELIPATLPIFRAPKKNPRRLNAEALERYRERLNLFLSERWEVPINLSESRSTVVVRFEIKKDGSLISYLIEQSSGNFVLDESVNFLLKNLQLLPSLPKSYHEDSYQFGVRFTPANF